MRISRCMEGIFIIIAILLFAATTNAADCYQWVDDTGMNNFTDSMDSVPQQYRASAKPCGTTSGSEPGLSIEQVTPETSSGTAQPAQTAQTQDQLGNTREYWANRVAEARERLRQAQDEYQRLQIEYNEAARKEFEASSTLADDTYTERKNSLQAQMTQKSLEINAAQEYLDVTLPKEAEAAGAPAEWLQ
jgi:hypothetical protein